MFEPLRIAFVFAGVLLLIGAMFYAASTMNLPGGFVDLATSLVVLYWFGIIIFVIGIFLKSLQYVVEAMRKKKPREGATTQRSLR